MAPGCARLETWGGRQNFRKRGDHGRRLMWTPASPACPAKAQGVSGPGSGQGLSRGSQESYPSEHGPQTWTRATHA